MSIVSVQKLAKCYGAQDIFSGLDASIARGDKIALVGANGVGKTTFVRILVGLEEPSSGQVIRARQLSVAYLPQQPEFASDQTLYGEMLRVYSGLVAQHRTLLDLAQEMSRAEDPVGLMSRYARAQERFDLAGGYEYENRIQRVLSGLGFGPDTYEWPVAMLSGGQVTRALLGKLLLERPELLVLDEPTNHLDLQALEWLESYLKDWPHALLVISHDRRFLDRVVTRVWDMHHGTMDSYGGNYSHFARQRQARAERLEREYRAQQTMIAKEEDFIRKYKAGQRSRQARGRETRLARVARIELPRRDRRIRLRLASDLRSGDLVLRSDGVSLGYQSRPEDVGGDHQGVAEPHLLFRTGSLLIQRGERVALMGPNGSGKTTLLRSVLGQINPLSGTLRIGASVRVGYLPQTQEWLDTSKTVLQHILDASDFLLEEARSHLGRYLFSGDDAFKSTGDLSGGELARLALAILTIARPNFLLLDEPTTHLDIASQEILQGALVDFTGTMLFVSHDRYLIDALATHVWMIDNGRLQTFKGNYSQYLQEHQSAPPDRGKAAPRKRPRRKRAHEEREAKRVERKREQELFSLESEIERLERDLASMTARLERASTAQDVTRVHSLAVEYEELTSELAQRMQDWEQVGSSGARD